MSALPRIDEIEDLLEKELTAGNIRKNLNEELIDELNQLNLLTNLISARITSFVIERLKKADETNSENSEQDQDTIESKISKQIAHEWFESQVDRYYFERRESFERVSFQMFRTFNKGIAVEAHQRLSEGEESWKTINERWGQESEKENEGKYIQVRADRINRSILKVLKRLKKGEVSEPVRAGGKAIVIVKLMNWNEVELDNERRKKIEGELYREWIKKKTNEVIKKIT